MGIRRKLPIALWSKGCSLCSGPWHGWSCGRDAGAWWACASVPLLLLTDRTVLVGVTVACLRAHTADIRKVLPSDYTRPPSQRQQDQNWACGHAMACLAALLKLISNPAAKGESYSNRIVLHGCTVRLPEGASSQ